MGVSTGGLANGESQDITIEIPAPGNTESAEMAEELQAIIDAFNSDFGANTLEVL